MNIVVRFAFLVAIGLSATRLSVDEKSNKKDVEYHLIPGLRRRTADGTSGQYIPEFSKVAKRRHMFEIGSTTNNNVSNRMGRGQGTNRRRWLVHCLEPEILIAHSGWRRDTSALLRGSRSHPDLPLAFGRAGPAGWSSGLALLGAGAASTTTGLR
jgi:hypothetical protein